MNVESLIGRLATQRHVFLQVGIKHATNLVLLTVPGTLIA